MRDTITLCLQNAWLPSAKTGMRRRIARFAELLEPCVARDNFYLLDGALQLQPIVPTQPFFNFSCSLRGSSLTARSYLQMSAM